MVVLRGIPKYCDTLMQIYEYKMTKGIYLMDSSEYFQVGI